MTDAPDDEPEPMLTIDRDPYTDEPVEPAIRVPLRAVTDAYANDPYGVMPALDGPARYLKATLDGKQIGYMTDEEMAAFDEKRRRKMARLARQYANRTTT